MEYLPIVTVHMCKGKRLTRIVKRTDRRRWTDWRTLDMNASDTSVFWISIVNFQWFSSRTFESSTRSRLKEMFYYCLLRSICVNIQYFGDHERITCLYYRSMAKSLLIIEAKHGCEFAYFFFFLASHEKEVLDIARQRTNNGISIIAGLSQTLFIMMWF